MLSRVLTTATALGLVAIVAQQALAAPAPQADAVVATISQQIAQVRGLTPKSETPVTPMAKSALVAKLSRELNEPRTIREFLTSQMLLEVLGATPRGYDLRQLQLRLLDEQTVALYDYQDRVIYMVADAADDLDANERLILAHELTHALQDQYFGLRGILPLKPENSDADMAARALVEGDAMLTMRIWGRQYLRPSDKRSLGDEPVPADPVLDTAPLLARGELLFPYDAGWVFAQLLYQDGGYDAVNQALMNPPRSTEQILHPEKYVAGEQPVRVTIEPLERSLNGDWQTLRTDTFGELVLRLLLEPHLGWADSEAAAAGWGGDVYTILEDGSGRRVVGMVTVWDTEADAAEMYNAFEASIEAQFKAGAARTVVQPSLARWTTPEYAIQAIKTDNVVRIAYAPDNGTLAQVEAALSAATIGAAGPVAPTPTRPQAAPSPAPAGPSALPSGSPTPVPATPENEPTDDASDEDS
ncbi:MAG: hypothetical protein IT306_16475 [Chloroflexi bacterium]|nr:hypothetical protein [Chloroflexota bacterium]